MKYFIFAFWFVLGLTVGENAFAVSGFVTPSKVTITFTSASLVRTDNSNTSLFDTAVAHTFSRDDANLTASSLGAIQVKEGRYIGVNICYNTNRSVMLNGVKYNGSTGSFADGATLYTTGTDATASNTLVTAPPNGGATTLTGLNVGDGTSNCSGTFFAKPICVAVAVNQSAVCNSTDTIMDPTVTSPDLQLMFDMYHSVGVDATNGKLDSHVAAYPYATLGKVGAAVHLSSINPQFYGDIVLLFGADKSLSYASATSNSGIAGFCSGVGAVNVTAAPAGALVNTFGPTWVMSSDRTGKVQFATGNCGSGSTCSSNGLLTIANALQAVGNTTSVVCTADTTGEIGFNYTGGAGSSGTATFTVTRIVDPNNMLGGICTTGGGTCTNQVGLAGYP